MSKCRVIASMGGSVGCTGSWCKIAEAERFGFEKAKKLAAEIVEHERHIEPGDAVSTQLSIYNAIQQMQFQN